MKELNMFQTHFMEALADIQEQCVADALYGKHNFSSREDELYALTSEVIYRIMELVDGYGCIDIGKLDIICEKTGARLKDNPFIELHDVVGNYMKE